MSKVAVYLGILGTIILGLNIYGILTDTGTSILLNLLKDPSQIFSLDFFLNINNALALGLSTGIVAGLILSQKFDLALIVGFTSTLLLIGWDILAIYNIVAVYSSEIALLVISPIVMLYGLTVFEWWRGIA